MKRLLCAILLLSLLLTGAAHAETWEPGDQFELGSWSIEGDPEPLSWTVISVNSFFLLAMADKPVQYAPYHKGGGTMSWMNSSMRNWLNNTFLKEAFNKTERKIVQRQQVINIAFSDDPESGLDTWDYVYLISSGELELYLPDGGWEIGEDWWLRGHGDEGGSCAEYVDAEGVIHHEGAVLDEVKAVRPLIIVNGKQVQKKK
ncbi:MAG: hypothetical protein IKP40_02645 [Clostridia bacterium]|nr:hypothetical protein [Clostridia bacterium]